MSFRSVIILNAVEYQHRDSPDVRTMNARVTKVFCHFGVILFCHNLYRYSYSDLENVKFDGLLVYDTHFHNHSVMCGQFCFIPDSKDPRIDID